MRIAALILLTVAGCSAAPKQAAEPAKAKDEAVVPSVGMANPASVYCVEKGGKLEIRNEKAGQLGFCHLPDGRGVEEGQLFRAEKGDGKGGGGSAADATGSPVSAPRG